MKKENAVFSNSFLAKVPDEFSSLLLQLENSTSTPTVVT